MLKYWVALAAAGAVLWACADLEAPEPATGAACAVEHVYDGDTVSLDCPGRPLERARLLGFDTPEVFSPGCAAEARLGAAATERLRDLVAAGTVTGLRRQGHDRYGRALVWLEIDGVDVGRVLIEDGLAVRYGGGRRIDWCARLS
ncbi:MAG: hypothetical protein HLUCCA08_06910 [Rhodobacteraceae bacterium HLUCCA08]|nr:MAG: hypothetical protein HLUCCA08_06910 [Rhodobacteraceae bacterium HLUCCA08]